MPTAFHSVEHLKKACESKEVASWMDNLAAKTNIRVLNIMLSGERHITSNKPIKTPADLNGIKFRASSSANFVAFCKALGVKATVVPMAEVYLGLQQGVIEAQENPIPTIMAQKFYEVQKYLIKTGHTFQCIMVGASDKKWQSLTDEQRSIIQRNLKLIQDQSFVVIPEESVKGEKFLTDHGMTIIEPDKEAFYAAGEIMTDALVKEYGQEIRDAYNFVQSLD
jgi:TRAP-type C4-dicarboxylate transport system substrate-binding protein